MLETLQKKKKFVMIAAIVTAVITLAQLTNATDTLLAKWRSLSPGILGFLRLVLPWIPSFALIFFVSVLLVIYWKEWRERVSIKTQKRNTEIQWLISHARDVSKYAELCFGPKYKKETNPKEFRHALDTLKDRLVQAGAYEYNFQLYKHLDDMEKECLSEFPNVNWDQLMPFLSVIDRWMEDADWEMSHRPPPRPGNPFKPMRLR